MVPEIRRRGFVLGESSEDSETLGLSGETLGVKKTVMADDARGGRARVAVALAVVRIGGEIAGPEDVVLVELVAGAGAGAGSSSVIGRRVGERTEEAVGGCGLLMADSGLSGYVHYGFGSGRFDWLLFLSKKRALIRLERGERERERERIDSVII
ncbi:hypothetical protein PanWU01x14_117430 [Parasponia andersonii]|uniref:Uncharacterized protein n=1 Tax=Parasponia andersonii TaxID=3476 RepID=A0A2P5CWL1_PARAD|nr:hypothetical protein PanWU01x14_117430 [Parasponia andersonii]